MRWHKSLYWRIAIGFVLFLAAMLVVQAMLFVLVVARSGRTVPGQSPGRFSETVALDLGDALGREPDLDIARYVREQYAQVSHPFFVMLADGQLITSGSDTFPESLQRMARARLQRRFDRPDGPRPEAGERGERPREGPPFGRGFRGDGLEREGPPFGRRPRGEGADRAGFPFVRPTPIVVAGRLAGVVVVPPDAPFAVVLGRFAPMLGAVAAGVLIVGTIAASGLIFGPARRRLRQLEGAARSFGAGDLSARAPARGGDEIAAVASAFNTMADDLTARAEALAASDRARRQLLADVSHELTTPVTAMRGYLETLTMPELSLDAATKERYLQIIADETARLERIIGDLLDLARLEGGGGALSVAEVPVSDLFDRVSARHERACERQHVTLSRTIEPGAEVVAGDRDRLEQALQNLAGNALRYAPAGSTIHLAARPARGRVTIAVADEGPGIAEEHLAHIFDRFYKAESSRTVNRPGDPNDGATYNGSGLGLSIVKAIVERHGGHISVDSKPGRTVFTITLGVPT
ncbi:MAG: HAMP domain-containing sensor histidine kinase [Acidobacteriota bacterium]